MAFKNLITIYYKDYILYKCLKNINCISFNNSGIKNKSDYSVRQVITYSFKKNMNMLRFKRGVINKIDLNDTISIRKNVIWP